MKRIQNMRGVFFDLYGTLLIYGDMRAAWSDWFTAFHTMLVPLGLSMSQESFSRECDRFFGKETPPKRNDGLTVFESRIHCLCDRLGLAPSTDEIAGIADHIAEAWQQHIRVDPDAATVLGALAGARTLALVSNFDHPRHVKKVLSHHQLAGFFQSIVISGDVGVSKPDPRIFELALKQTGLSASEVVYVGDTEEDVIASRSAGIVPVLIQRPANATDLNALDFKSDDQATGLACGHTVDIATTKVTSLRQLLQLMA